MSFYDEVLRELVVALGAALVVGNSVALRPAPVDVPGAGPGTGRRSTKAKGSSRARGGRHRDRASWCRRPSPARSRSSCSAW